MDAAPNAGACLRCGYYLPEGADFDEATNGLEQYGAVCAKTGRQFDDTHRGDAPPWCPLRKEDAEMDEEGAGAAGSGQVGKEG